MDWHGSSLWFAARGCCIDPCRLHAFCEPKVSHLTVIDFQLCTAVAGAQPVGRFAHARGCCKYFEVKGLSVVSCSPRGPSDDSSSFDCELLSGGNVEAAEVFLEPSAEAMVCWESLFFQASERHINIKIPLRKPIPSAVFGMIF